MIINSKHLAKVLFDIHKSGDRQMEEKFFNFVREKKIESQMRSVLHRVEKMIEEDKEKTGIKIEVPHDISQKTVEDIKNFLDAKNLVPHVKLNKSLIAGFRAKWNGGAYDASFASSLKKIEEVINR